MDTALNVIFTIDDKFIQHFAVTLISILENNKDINLSFYVVHNINDTTLLDEVITFTEKKYGRTITPLLIDSSTFDKFKTNLHYSKAVYFRLLFTEILSSDIDKILFLDADTVINGSLKEFADYQFDKLQLLAVNDHGFDGHVERLNKMGFPVKKYFNAGVLLINLKGWRQINAAHDLMELADKYMDQLDWWDQDLLNMYFYNDWDYMDQKYNTVGEQLAKDNPPVIIHYSGKLKPWFYRYDPPYKELYWKYLKLTPFKDVKYPDFNLKVIIVKQYYKLKEAYFPDFKLPSFIKKAIK